MSRVHRLAVTLALAAVCVPSAAGAELAQVALGTDSKVILTNMLSSAEGGGGAGVQNAFDQLQPVTAQIANVMGIDLGAEGAGLSGKGKVDLVKFSQRYIAASVLSILYHGGGVGWENAAGVKVGVKVAYKEIAVLFDIPPVIRKSFAVMTAVGGKNQKLYLKQVEAVRKTMGVRFAHCDIPAPAG